MLAEFAPSSDSRRSSIDRLGEGLRAAVRAARENAPGLLLVLVLAAVARLLGSRLPSAVSEIALGVVLGVLVANTLGVRPELRLGVRFAVGTPLRLGIVLLGAGLSFGDVLTTGMGALVVIAACMAFALGTVALLGHVMGVPRRLALLIAVGTAVCGNTAIIATAPVIEAKEREVSFAVATITLFGVLAVIIYPLIGASLGMEDRLFGQWAGIAVNDTSQVTATGFAYSNGAGEIATVIKLTRNVLMAPLIIVIGLVYMRLGLSKPSGYRRDGVRLSSVVPTFVLGFLALAAANSVGIIAANVADSLATASKALILIALVAVGLNTDVRQMRAVGARPLVVGLVSAASLSMVALGLTAVTLQ